jgi:hypothetical protein
MSINDATGANRSPVTGQVAALSRDVFAGLIASTISVAYGLSFAALIFAPPLTPWIAYGIADVPDHGYQRRIRGGAELPALRHRRT